MGFLFVEAGRVELPSEIKPQKTSTCLVYRIDLVLLTTGDPNYKEPVQSILFDPLGHRTEPAYVYDALK